MRTVTLPVFIGNILDFLTFRAELFNYLFFLSHLFTIIDKTVRSE